MGYQLALIIARSFEPFILTALLGRYGYLTVALHMRVMALITIVAIHLTTETYKRYIAKKDIARRRSDEERPLPEASTGEQTPIGMVRELPKPSVLERASTN